MNIILWQEDLIFMGLLPIIIYFYFFILLYIMSSVPFLRLGNKTQDSKYIEKYLPFNIKTIVEPFAGSFAISRLYYDSSKYNVVINDNDEELIYIINHLKPYIKIQKQINKYITSYSPNLKSLKNYVEKLNINPLFKNIIIGTHVIKGFVKIKNPNETYDDLINYVKNIEVHNKDYEIIMNKYKNNKNTFIFCDPPYFDSDNSNYQNYKNKTINKIIKDNTGMYVYLHKYIQICKCKIMIVVNDNELMRFLFDGFIKDTYEKIYQISKKKTMHLIITNY